MSYAIEIENLSKKYLISRNNKKQPYATLREEIQNKLLSIPALLRTKDKETSLKDFWALKDINLKINQGEKVGIIGPNGAGKSTLLKILSRITYPTTGEIKLSGRVSSLLEVGTGFHPELTGRENIFFNGAIIGMTHSEVVKRFDEIVDFAGVEEFLETPVKRYSSGMRLRLGFAVAAHLDSEILLIDEVLAVGDAEFQKKCLGKMDEVSTKEGRTIFFVSHNITALKSLCDIGVYLNHGEILKQGDINEVIDTYMFNTKSDCCYERKWDSDNEYDGTFFQIQKVTINFESQKLTTQDPFKIEFEFFNKCAGKKINISMILFDVYNNPVFNISTKPEILNSEDYKAVFNIPGNFMNDGIYSIKFLFVEDASKAILTLADILRFEIEDYRKSSAWHGKWQGAVRPTFIKTEMVMNNE